MQALGWGQAWIELTDVIGRSKKMEGKGKHLSDMLGNRVKELTPYQLSQLDDGIADMLGLKRDDTAKVKEEKSAGQGTVGPKVVL